MTALFSKKKTKPLPPDPSFNHVIFSMIEEREKKGDTEDAIASDIQQLGESKRRFEKNFKKLYS